MTFTATANDPEGGAVTWQWQKSTNGGAFQTIAGATTSNPTIRLRWVGPCTATQYVIRAIAHDPGGNPGQDDYPIAISTLC